MRPGARSIAIPTTHSSANPPTRPIDNSARPNHGTSPSLASAPTWPAPSAGETDRARHVACASFPAETGLAFFWAACPDFQARKSSRVGTLLMFD